MKIAHFGTFDVENYGDLLFPLLLERRLGGKEIEFVHVSPVGGAPDLKDCKPAIGFEEALAGCESWDAIVFGGGALGHGESAGDVEKYRDPAIHTIAYPGLWLLPAFIAHLRGIPLVWNAPGIPGNFSEERKRQLMQWACWQADYLSVRDVKSATVLAESLVEAKVVPDTAVEVSNLWSDRELRAEIARLKRREEWPQNHYLALHLNQRYADADLVALAEEIKQIGGSRGAVALLIAIGGCHGDEAFARRILEHLQGHQATIFVPDSLRSVAAAIRFSDGYVGSSLHGAITAYSLARPFLIVAPESRSKFAGFLAHVGAQDRRVATWAAAVEVVGHWPPSKQQTEIAGGQNKPVMEALDQHWATLSERLTRRRPASSLAGAQLLETLSQMPPEWFPFIPMLERSPLFAQVIEKYREPWNSVRRQLQNSAFVAAAAYRRLDLRHQKLISDVSNLQAKLSEQKKTVEKLGGQIQEQREKASALQKAVERRDRQIQELENRMAQEGASAAALGEKFDKSEKEKSQLKEKISLQTAAIERRDGDAEKMRKILAQLERRIQDEEQQRAKSDETLHAALKDITKLGKWSDRLLQDYQRILKSNRWRLGCWLSLKRADERSKEAQRLAQLIASRPHLARGRRDVAPIRSSTGKGKLDGLTSMPSEARRLTPLLATRPQLTGANKERQPTSRKIPVPRKADVIVCVHNALDDVRRCLASIVKHRSARLNKLILVNDGSDEQTTNYLRQLIPEAQIRTVLLEDPQPSGYTKAANRGLAAREAEYAILLNSDTIVTVSWIDRLIACGESDSSIGIIGPLSNAASWQSVPERYSPNGDWAVNELPLSSLDRISCIFSILHAPRYPRVPLVNGFCFAIKSALIDAIGLLDDELFPSGYGEENDYCLRAGKAGFSAAIADDCYLFHAKSRSYSHEARHKLAGRSRAVLRQKYGSEVEEATDVLRNSPELARARSVFARVVDAPPCSILFLMNFRGAGGGINSIVQEADGLRKLGAAVQVAIRSKDEGFYRERFPGIAGNLFHTCDSTADLISYATGFEFVVATLFKSVRTLRTVLEQAPGVIPCYYIQDYEPNFFHPSNAHYQEAVESYTLIPEMRCFAKTRWLCETVAQKHGVHVHKVEPSMDRGIFFPDDRPKPGTPFVVCAMVRPTSERRSPGLTFEILRRIKREFGESVEVRMFGLEENDPFLRRQPADFEYNVLGVLDRHGVAKLMRESSLFIDASTYQAFGRTGLEAMACRCATILPCEGGISEYAVDGVNTLLAAPNDAGDVLRKIRRYIKEPELYQSIVEVGCKTASRYSIEEACASELQFFDSLRGDAGAERSAALHVAGSSSSVAV